MHLEIINSILIFNRGVKKLAIKPCKILILIFIWTLIFHCNIGFSQCIDFKTHGTLVVGVICDNGIVLSSDSRASFTCDCPESSTTYAYTDSNRKIFPLGKFQIAVTGNSSIKNEYWEELIIQYNKHNKNDSILHSIFHNFKIFVQKKLALTDSIFFSGTRFYLAGYENKNPKIIMFYENGVDSITKVGNRYYSLNEFKPYYNSKGVSLQNYDVEVISKLLIGSYKDYAKIDKTVGGPTNIISIAEDNSSSQLSTFNFIKFKKEIDLLKSIKKGYRKVYFDTPKAEQFFQKMIDFILKYPKIIKR